MMVTSWPGLAIGGSAFELEDVWHPAHEVHAVARLVPDKSQVKRDGEGGQGAALGAI